MNINQRSMPVRSLHDNLLPASSMQEHISLMSMPGDVARRILQVGSDAFGGKGERLRCFGLDRVSDARLLLMALGLFGCLYLNGPGSAMAANISAHQRGILIQGAIQKGDYAKIIQFIRQPDNYERFARTVFLDSPGGDLVEAMQNLTCSTRVMHPRSWLGGRVVPVLASSSG